MWWMHNSEQSSVWGCRITVTLHCTWNNYYIVCIPRVRTLCPSIKIKLRLKLHSKLRLQQTQLRMQLQTQLHAARSFSSPMFGLLIDHLLTTAQNLHQLVHIGFLILLLIFVKGQPGNQFRLRDCASHALQRNNSHAPGSKMNGRWEKSKKLQDVVYACWFVYNVCLE